MKKQQVNSSKAIEAIVLLDLNILLSMNLLSTKCYYINNSISSTSYNNKSNISELIVKYQIIYLSVEII